MNGLRVFLVVALAAIGAHAQTLSYYYTMRAGRFAGADWELGVGSSTNASNSTLNFNYGQGPGNNHWGSALTEHQFEIGWLAASNTAYVSVRNFAGNYVTTNFANAGPAISPTATWTIPANSFFVSAAAQPLATSVTLSNLSLSPGVGVLSGTLPASIGASQILSSGDFDSLSAPLVINPASAGGNWYISGTIRFTGLQSQGGSAGGSQLQFMMNAIAGNAATVPEAGTFSMIGLGLAAVAGIRRRMRRGETRA